MSVLLDRGAVTVNSNADATIVVSGRLGATVSESMFSQIDENASLTHIDLSGVESINAIGLLNIVLVAKRLRMLDCRVSLTLPTDIRVVAQLKHAHVLGYLTSFGISYDRRAIPEQYQSSTVLPLQIVDSAEAVVQVTRRATAYLGSIPHYPGGAISSAAITISELCANLVEHSGPPRTGYLAVGVQRNGSRLITVVGVGDIGVGMRESLAPWLRANGKETLSDARVLLEATRFGVSSKPAIGRGGGLHTVLRYTRNLPCHFGMRSGRALLILPPEGRRTVLHGSFFPGTQVYVGAEVAS